MSGQLSPAEKVVELRQTLAQLIVETDNQRLTSRSRRALEAEVRTVMEELAAFLDHLDPIR